MRFRHLVAAMFALAAAACSSGGSSSSSSPAAPAPAATPSAPASASSGALTVTIMGQKNDQSFSPNPVQLSQGGTVIWKNGDNTVHHIVMNDGSFDSGDLGPGATSKAMTLSSSGGKYHCTIHPTTMFGSINMATAAQPSDPGTPGYPY